MKIELNRLARTLGSLAAVSLIAGCASSGVRNPSGVPVTELKADERGFVAGTGVESQDLVAVTDKMARSILGIPEIANAQGMPRVMLYPVENATRFPINKDIFLSRIRADLNSKARGKVRFLVRSAGAQSDPKMAALERERDLKESGQVTSDPAKDTGATQFRSADFFLTGKLEGMTTRTGQGTGDYILYTFQLIDTRTSEIVWEDSAEIKKQGLEDAAYR
ncbi:MAG: penicillin-binding protein activator LpoB [Verrucomicrobiota bacterium]